MNKYEQNKYYNIIPNDYISGLTHADGTFNISIIKKGKYKLYLNPRYILTQHIDNIHILNTIKVKFNNKGNIKIQSNNICKYTINNKEDIYNNVIPFFNIHQVRGNRYLSFLKYKLVINILINENIVYNSPLWLFCLMVSVYINPMVSISKQIRYLNNDQIQMINNKVLPINIDLYNTLIKKYCNELQGIDIFNNNENTVINNTQALNSDFVNGLFDGDGSLSLRLINNKTFTIGFKIVQDIYNKGILDELYLFFNKVGRIQYKDKERSISYYNSNPKEFYYNIVPVLLNIKDISKVNLDNLNYNDLNGPKIKLYKIYNFMYIYNLLLNNSINDINIYNTVLLYLYKTGLNKNKLTFNEWKNNIKI